MNAQSQRVKRRIFGVETEYGLMCARTDGQPSDIDQDMAARVLFKPLIDQGRSSNVYWRNGGRIYLDVGSHPEYATAECDTVEDLLRQDRAGDYLFADLARRGSETLQAQGTAAQIHLFRNNEDIEGHSFGCHENYLLRRRSNFREVADAIVSFFVTRQIVTGAGHIHRTDQPRFGYSPRAQHMDDAVSAATTRSRPIINTRDEPLADAGEYRRLHVIVGDTNMSESSTAVKIVMTNLLLAAVENGARIGDLALADPLSAIRHIDSELGSNIDLQLADGRTMSVVDIQRELRQRTLNSVNLQGASTLTHNMIDLWERALNAVESGDHSGVKTELDWAIKKELIERFMRRSGADLTDPRVTRLELAYHDITGQTLRSRLENAGAMKRLSDEERVKSAMEIPPATTRAHLRGTVIAEAERYRRDVSVDWVHLRLDDDRSSGIALHDPFSHVDQRVDDMLSSIRETETGVGAFA
ncbi:MAG: Pup--protein ligase [Actinomycetaceae bacterium]|nr:Pup--protein ligase [Actinomycetaceae bacterium]